MGLDDLGFEILGFESLWSTCYILKGELHSNV